MSSKRAYLRDENFKSTFSERSSKEITCSNSKNKQYKQRYNNE